MKTCQKCKQEKPIAAYGARKDSKDGRQYICRPCKAEAHQARREANLASILAAKSRRANTARDFIIEFFKSNPCVDCGNSDMRVLEFDHVRGDKFCGVGKLAREGRNLELVKQEIAKCEVRCKNCHTIKTYERMGGTWHDLYLSI